MRGKDERGNTEVCGWGITPAYAGKRWTGETATVNVGDHPRLCGEKFLPALFSATRAGSPPPMRGKVRTAWEKIVQSGITPAYAGKSDNVP